MNQLRLYSPSPQIISYNISIFRIGCPKSNVDFLYNTYQQFILKSIVTEINKKNNRYNMIKKLYFIILNIKISVIVVFI